MSQTLPVRFMGELAPEFNELFSDFALSRYQRPDLDLTTRALCTVSALVAMGETPYAANWINNAMALGVTQAQITELLCQLTFYIGVPRAGHAFEAAAAVFAARNARSASETVPDA